MLLRLLRRVAPCGPLSRFERMDQGSVLPMFALMATALVGFVGLSVDAARGYMVRSHLTSALDSAALAAAKAINAKSDAELEAEVLNFLNANFPDQKLGATVNAPTINVTRTNSMDQSIEVTASATIESSFMGVLGFHDVTVQATSEAKRENFGTEITLIIDNTGSMKGSKMTSVKVAAAAFVEDIFQGDSSLPNLWMSLVPYSAAVNVGPENSAWVTDFTTRRNDMDYIQDPYDDREPSWKGCVEARAFPLDTTDDTPDDGLWDAYFHESTLVDSEYQNNAWRDSDSWEYNHAVDERRSVGATSNNYTGPNMGCPPPITPLTNVRQPLIDGIELMDSWHRGGTFAVQGMSWGWRTISPRWRGMWSGAASSDLPLDYPQDTSDNTQKFAVILTDGVQQWYQNNYTAYGVLSEGRLGITNNGDAPGVLNPRLQAICTEMKNTGIEIFTVTYELNNENTKSVYRQCATRPSNYYDAEVGDVVGVFKDMARKILTIRLSM